jgi:hypothetical protein
MVITRRDVSTLGRDCARTFVPDRSAAPLERSHSVGRSVVRTAAERSALVRWRGWAPHPRGRKSGLFEGFGGRNAGENDTSGTVRKIGSNKVYFQRLVMAERVGFAPSHVVANTGLSGFQLPPDPLEPLESLGRRTYCARGASPRSARPAVRARGMVSARRSTSSRAERWWHFSK